MTFTQRLPSFISSAWQRLDRPSAWRYAMIALLLVFGLMSLRLGHDDNWDLKNYHLYKPFALLSGKIGVDLAPARWQSYFNPTLDLLYYGLTHALPARAAGFIMGWPHLLNFVLAAAIARHALRRPGYRDPLFPQFNDRFHGPLGAPIGIGDTGWLPNGLAEKFLWPFILAIGRKRWTYQLCTVAARPAIAP